MKGPVFLNEGPSFLNEEPGFRKEDQLFFILRYRASVCALNFLVFLNSASSAAALVFYLPGVCTHTDTEGKQREARVWNILKSLEKTQYLMKTLY